MTRVNCIPVNELHGNHLLAEYRELPRVFTYLAEVLENGKTLKVPERFCLGAGHVLFFTDKLLFLQKRHQDIIWECFLRGYEITMTGKLCNTHIGIPERFWKDWTPDQADIELSRKRINQRLKEMEGLI